MKKQTGAIVAIIGLIVLSLGYVLTKPDSPTNSDATTPPASTPADSPDPSETETQTTLSSPSNVPTQPAPGKYTPYSADALRIAQGGRRVLFFHAAWCPQCQALEKDIIAKGVPAGMTILKVDFDNAQALRKKYGVTQQTTLVELQDDEGLRKKFVAYYEPTLTAVLKALGE